MKLRTIIGLRAEADIQAAHDWWAKHRSPAQAARWYDGIYEAAKSIGDQPQRFPLAAESGRVGFELRETFFGLGRRPTHRVLFTIRPDVVYVLAVRHVSQDAVGPDDL